MIDWINYKFASDEDTLALTALQYGLEHDSEEFLEIVDGEVYKKVKAEQFKNKDLALDLKAFRNWRVKVLDKNETPLEERFLVFKS